MVDFNASFDALRSSLQRLLTSNDVLPLEARLPPAGLNDEHAVSVFVRFAGRMIEVAEFVRESVAYDDVVTAVSIVVTVGLVAAGGYVMRYLVKMEEESVQRKLGAKGLKVRY